MQRLRRQFRYDLLRVGSLPYRWRLASFLVIALALPSVSFCQQIPHSVPPVLVENMDGQEPQLRPLQATSGFSITQRAIDRERFQHGSGAEMIAVRGPAGRTLPLAYSLPPAPVIQELAIRADVLTNRAGALLAAQVVLPRTRNPETGRPFELLVRSTSNGSGGRWEQLSISNLPQLLANHARVARVKYGTALDERGAYVSKLVFLTPGGAGTTELVVDRIQVFGVVRKHPEHFASPPPPGTSPAPQPANPTSAERSNNSPPRIPRIIQWQGESFDELWQLGFNTIGLNRLPTDAQLRQADQLGMALVCPPPAPRKLSSDGIGKKFAPVLAWDLGEQISADDLAQAERWEQLIARCDPVAGRPTVSAPRLHTLHASRIADIMLVGRPTLGTELTVREHIAWLTQRQRLARPGTPCWVTLETQLSPQQQLQAVALSSGGNAESNASYGQLTALTTAALSVKSRGFFFHSQSPLVLEDSAPQRRPLALELTNLRLQLAEPWLVASKEITSARSSQPELSALVLQAERSHLLVPIWWSGSLRAKNPPRTGGPLSLVVPGVGESSEAYLVTLGGMQRLRRQRVTGGMRIALDELPYDGLILFSDDKRAVAQVTRYLRRIAPRATKIRRELASMRLQEATKLMASLPDADSPSSQSALQQCHHELAACDRLLNSQNYELAYLRADAAELALDQLENELRIQFARTNPVTRQNYGSIQLIDQLQLNRSIARAPVGDNLLPGGGFENLQTLLESGWRHKQLPLDGITTAVRLTPEAPHSGSYCLELEARSINENTPGIIIPTAPVWISSTPLEVRTGDLVEITGVARLPAPLVGSVDGLQIIDSLGGPAMALRIHEAPSWQPFRLLRAATSDAKVSVTIALSGLGKAQIDDVAVRLIQRR